MKVAVWFIAAVCSYLISGVNLSIILSKAVYHKDIRKMGSGNPGFTNFKRCFGNKLAWFILVFDLMKAALPCVLFGFAFASLGMDRQLGVAFSGAFSLLGHAFPPYYGFRGGKGFLVNLSVIWALDWRAGAIATLLLVVLLLTAKYMSLSTMAALTAGAISLFFFGCSVPAAIIYCACVLFMIWRHSENIKRLIDGTEKKFVLFSKKEETQQKIET